MKILYGIQLTGNGHITRSIEIIKSLKERGFEVDIITSGTNSQLKLPYEVKKHHKGLSFHYNSNGGIDWLKTVSKLDLIRLMRDTKYDTTIYDIVISDFEPISAYSARRHGTKSIGIGNQYSINCKSSPIHKKDFLAELFIKNFAKCKKNIAIGYKKYEESMSLPVIGTSLLNREAKEEDFYVVYLPSISTEYLKQSIKKYGGGNWIIYSPESKSMEKDGNITTKAPNKEEFTQDLLNCRGVITAAGFSTTSEALVLKKKLWSIPIKGQYEQLCNSCILKEMGIFTNPFDSESIGEWVSGYDKIEYSWENPISEIVEKIIRYNEEN